MDLQVALLCALVYYVVWEFDSLIGWQACTRPIVIAPITGLVLGDPTTGIIMGAELEALYMGISAIGGVIPADAYSSSIISVALTISTNADMETGLALAMPIGTIMAQIRPLVKTLVSVIQPWYMDMAEKGEYRKFTIALFGVELTLGKIFDTLIVFFATGFGVTAVESAIAVLPTFILSGFSAAGGMLTAIGLALISVSIWSKETGVFVFLGFILAKYLGLGTLPIAVLALVFVVPLFFIEQRLTKTENNRVVATNSGNLDEEDESFYG